MPVRCTAAAVARTRTDETLRFGEREVPMRVLAIGATGQYAGLVVPALASRGVKVRALVHDPAKRDRVLAAGADEAVVGDLRDPGSIRTALDAVDGVFLIIPAFAPDTAALGTGVVAAAQAAGVRRLVVGCHGRRVRHALLEGVGDDVRRLPRRRRDRRHRLHH
jgi:uncharacterized protein YbjT (DUF2867 family)